jgi:hypothetical protein
MSDRKTERDGEICTSIRGEREREANMNGLERESEREVSE